MASAFPSKIKGGHLCHICSSELREPICLSCGHSFCSFCLQTWHQASKDKAYVICPKCKKETALPTRCVQGETALPTRCVQGLQYRCHMEPFRQSKTTTALSIPCSVCGKRSDLHCLDCNKSLCSSCQTSHSTFIKDHKTVAIEDFVSGQATTTGRFCSVHHDEQVRYYCETEEKQVCIDCVSLNVCPTEHKRVTLKEAAQKHIILIKDAQLKYDDSMKRCQVSIQECDMILSKLDESRKQTEAKLDQCKDRYITQVYDEFRALTLEFKKVNTDQVKDIESNKLTIQMAMESELCKVDRVNKKVTDVINSNSEHLITYKFSALHKQLTKMCELTLPTTPPRSLNYLKYEHHLHISPMMGFFSKSEKGYLSRSFSLGNLEIPRGIDVNHDGDIIVGTANDNSLQSDMLHKLHVLFKRRTNGITIFEKNGKEKCTFIEGYCNDVAFTCDDRCVVANSEGLQFYTMEGKCLSKIPFRDSTIQTVSINSKGQIIAGLGQKTISYYDGHTRRTQRVHGRKTNSSRDGQTKLVGGKTVSIYYADGSPMLEFKTANDPCSVAETCDKTVVCSFCNPSSVQLYNYSSNHVKNVKPPSRIQTWSPTYLCCGQGQIFIVNSGVPVGIYSFTAAGGYIRCITTKVTDPKGIALSPDGSELFVVDEGKVKIFHME